MVPGKAKQMMKGFSFKPKNKKTGGAESSTPPSLEKGVGKSSPFYIESATTNEEDGGVGGTLSPEEREKLYASVAAKHEEVAQISGTDIWMKV